MREAQWEAQVNKRKQEQELMSEQVSRPASRVARSSLIQVAIIIGGLITHVLF